MHKIKSYLCFLLLCFQMNAFAQTQSEKLTVFVSLDSFSNSSVSYSWDNFSISTTSIYRKKMEDISWTTVQTGLTSTSYTDNTIQDSTEYEYKFVVYTGLSSPSMAVGYTAFGVNIPKKTTRGNILLLVEDRLKDSIASELETLRNDLITDGWNPKITFCSRDSSASSVKDIIDGINNTTSIDALYLIGHVPVPYSGSIMPDGHTDHRGAWPTDLFYATPKTDWTDNTLNFKNTSNSDMNNVPSDGKFDLNAIASELLFPVSRIDFHNLPSQSNSEADMLRNYLTEASKYKHGETTVTNAGLIDNKLVNLSEGFASNGYRNFNSLMSDTITEGNLLSSLQGNTYKWTYAAGYGTDTSIINTASISSLNASNYKGIFSMAFGSYFGDWNTQDNFMRSLLADGKMLTTCWAGRPNWFFHHMGLNNPIALSAKKSMENGAGWSSLNATAYDYAGLSQNNVHMALLGDLTLRQNHIPDITNLDIKYNDQTHYLTLTWDLPVIDGITEVEIYKSGDTGTTYSLIANLSGNQETFLDTQVTYLNFYYVRYIRLDTTNSGTYYNNSLGVLINTDTDYDYTIGSVPAELIEFTATKTAESAVLNWITASEENVSHFEIQKSRDLNLWETLGSVTAVGNSQNINYYDFTDLDLKNGISYYRLKTIDFDGYTEISAVEIIEYHATEVTIYPNPSFNNTVTIKADRLLTDEEYNQIELLDASGRSVSFQMDKYNGTITINNRKGLYYIKILGEAKRIVLL